MFFANLAAMSASCRASSAAHCDFISSTSRLAASAFSARSLRFSATCWSSTRTASSAFFLMSAISRACLSSFLSRSASYITSNAACSLAAVSLAAAFSSSCDDLPSSAALSCALESPWRTPSQPSRHWRYSICSANATRSSSLRRTRSTARLSSAALRSSGVTWLATSSFCRASSSAWSLAASLRRRASTLASAWALSASNLSGVKRGGRMRWSAIAVNSQVYRGELWERGNAVRGGVYRVVARPYRCLNWFLAIMLLLLCSQTAPNSFVFHDCYGDGR